MGQKLFRTHALYARKQLSIMICILYIAVEFGVLLNTFKLKLSQPMFPVFNVKISFSMVGVRRSMEESLEWG